MSLCKCGCGLETKIAPRSYLSRRIVKGQPYDYLLGHGTKNSGRKPIETRYEVDPVTGCWNWLLSTDRSGYGIDNRSPAHRAMYIRLKGEIPLGLELDHKCRNRRCVNPDHLEPVTDAENTRRGNVATLTYEQVVEVKRLLREGGKTRREIGALYGVGKSAVQKISSGKNWRDVEEIPQSSAA